MARKKHDNAKDDWRSHGCALCTDERNALIAAHIERFGKKPPSEELPFVMMAKAQCRAWVTPIVGQPGHEHLLPVCEAHMVRAGKLVRCVQCANTTKHAVIKPPKAQQISLLEFCEAAA